MRATNKSMLVLGIFAVAGLLMVIAGNVMIGGDTRAAFNYLGTGTTALNSVLLLETMRRRSELKKTAPGHAR